MKPTKFQLQISKLGQKMEIYALKLTKNKENAEDLLQETILKALANEDKFAQGTNLNGWVYTIMRNTFISSSKRLSNKTTFIDKTEGQHFLNNLKTSANQATANLVVDDIHGAIKNLAYSYRMPFKLFFMGYKYHEIAERLRMPMGTVKNHIHVARKKLKEELKVYEFAE